MNTYDGDKQEDRIPDQQTKGVGAGTQMTDGRHNNDIVYEPPKHENMKSSWNSRSWEIRTRSGHISHRPERLEINQ